MTTGIPENVGVKKMVFLYVFALQNLNKASQAESS